MGRHRLPPLHLIVGFEAAARLRSFKLAAQELSLTPSAVSQRIRKLEDTLGVKLFGRLVRGIELTPTGLEYHDEVRRILGELSDVTRRFSSPVRRVFTIAMTSVVAQEMVIPKLGILGSVAGVSTIDVVTRTSMKTFSPDDADAGIRIGVGPWPGFEHRMIGSLTTVPLCAPVLSDKIRDWDDVFAQTLFCAKSREAETRASLRHPETGRSHANVVGFQTLAEAVRAAEAGLGVVVGLMPLMNNLVRQGRLVAAFGKPCATDEGVTFIFRPDHSRGESLGGIYDWLADCYHSLPVLERVAEGDDGDACRTS